MVGSLFDGLNRREPQAPTLFWLRPHALFSDGGVGLVLDETIFLSRSRRAATRRNCRLASSRPRCGGIVPDTRSARTADAGRPLTDTEQASRLGVHASTTLITSRHLYPAPPAGHSSSPLHRPPNKLRARRRSRTKTGRRFLSLSPRPQCARQLRRPSKARASEDRLHSDAAGDRPPRRITAAAGRSCTETARKS